MKARFFSVCILLTVYFNNYSMFSLATLKTSTKLASSAILLNSIRQRLALYQGCAFSFKNNNNQKDTERQILDVCWSGLENKTKALVLKSEGQGMRNKFQVESFKLKGDVYNDTPIDVLENPSANEMRIIFGKLLSDYKIAKARIPEQIVRPYNCVNRVITLDTHKTIIVTGAGWAIYDNKTLKWVNGEWSQYSNFYNTELLWLGAVNNKMVALVKEEVNYCYEKDLVENVFIKIFDIDKLFLGKFEPTIITRDVEMRYEYHLNNGPLAITSDGNYLVYASNKLIVYSLNTGHVISSTSYSKNYKNAVCTALTISPDGKEVIAIVESGSENNNWKRHIKRWFLKNGVLDKENK